MTAPAIPLCPTPDTHPTTCPRPHRSAETYYGHPIATTPDISTYQEQHVTQPALVKCSVDICPARTDYQAPAADWTCDTIGRPFCPAHPVDTACRICGRDKGSNRILCRPCATGEEPAPDDPGQSRTAPDTPAGGDAADSLLATPAELERRQRWAWSRAGLCPMCSHEGGKGRLCDACEADVRAMRPAYRRRPWERFRQLSTGAPIQGSGYTPAELLGGDETVATHHNVEAGVRAAAQVAVDSVAKALGATREEFVLTGPADDATYFCPTSGDVESPTHGGFDTCCDRPDLHQPTTVARPATLADLLTHTLEDQGISQADLARRARLSTKHVSKICKGSARISIDAEVQPSGPNLEIEAENANQAEDGELTAEEARDLADQLGLDLYRAQDALAFVEECCVIADREGLPVTTAHVRQWLQGAKCGRQMAAGPVATLRNAPDLRDQLTAALEECRTLIPEAQADAVLAVVDTALSERAQAAIRQLEQQVEVRERQLGAVRQLSTDLTADAEQMRGDEADNLRKIARLMREALGETSGGEPSP